MNRVPPGPKGSIVSGLVGWIGDLAARRSRLLVGIWIAVVSLLAMQGQSIEDEVTIHPFYANGTASKRAHEIALREFGSDYAMVVMLRGPSAAVEDQGRRLASRLDALPRTLVVSPWTRGVAVDGLSPSPGVAALVVRTEGVGVEGLLPPVQRQVDGSVTSPVRASIAGFPSVIDSLRTAGEKATITGELIAVPVLLIVLLFVFRSVLAALLPVIVGGAVVAAARGVLSLLLGLIQIDLFALGVVGMMGLALGVDYSLLVVSRFREECERRDVADAVRATVSATTRSIVPAGCALLVAMLISSLMLPGAIVRSIAISISTVTVLSMLSAVCVVPAMLKMLGDNLDRWSLPRRQASQVAPLRWSRRIIGQPRAVIGIFIALLFCAAWAYTLRTGSTTIALLPPGDPGRQQQEEVEDALGPGWLTPMEVVMDGRGRPVTSPDRLHALADFQRHVEADPGVKAVAGFSEIENGAEQLGEIEGELADQERGLSQLQAGIAKLGKGATLNSEGLLKAAQGSSALGSGLGAANAGAGALAGGLEETSSGSIRLVQGLGQADEGSGQLAQGTTKASSGAGRLAEGLARAQEKTGGLLSSAGLFKNAMRSGNQRLDALHAPLQETEGRLAAAWQALQRMSSGREDPEYAAAVRAVEEANQRLTGNEIGSGEQADPSFDGVEGGVEKAAGQFDVGLYLASRLDREGRKASEGIGKLARASTKLDRGLRRLASGSREVSDGVAALTRGGEALSPALRKLSEGAQRLSGGLGQLETGAGQLAGGLGTGAQKSTLLIDALDRIESGLAQRNDPDGSGSMLDRLQTRSPGLFHSPYFVLASLDGTPAPQRSQLGFLVNLDRGGTDARMLVIPRDDPTSERARQTKERLDRDAEELSRKTGAEVVVGGAAPVEIDLNDMLRERVPLMRLALSLISLIILIPVMRSLTIPLIAAALNLITVSASFGLLSVLFNGSLLGGPGYVDVAVILSTMMLMFGLAIDYEVFVLARIREEYLRTGSTRAAVEYGLDHTAHVVTGAAIIMIAVFLAFSVSEFMSYRNFGVAQAIAVFIDAFIVRLILIPAAMGWLGERSWWIPRWLDRLLPGGSALPRGGDLREAS